MITVPWRSAVGQICTTGTVTARNQRPEGGRQHRERVYRQEVAVETTI
jgi:hypothetical protein